MEETPGKTQETAERRLFSAARGAPQDSLGGAGRNGQGEECLGVLDFCPVPS